MYPLIVAAQAPLIALLVVAACGPLAGPTPAFGSVAFDIDGTITTLDNAACTWYEDSGQLFVEAGNSEGADYILLAAPLDWLGQPLPEGPAEPAEVSLRIGGEEASVDQDTLTGTMTAEQSEGTFRVQLTDGTPVTGEWECPEVLEE